MSLEPKDLNKLKKLMMLTTSHYDNEALTALRKAQLILSRADYTWEDLLSDRPMATRDVDEDEEDIDEEVLKDYFSRRASEDDMSNKLNSLLIRVRSPSFRQFVLSVAQQYMEKGFLSEAQRQAISDAYRRQNKR